MAGFSIDPVRPTGDEGSALAPRDLMAHPEWFAQFSDPLDPAEGVDPSDARYIAANTQHWIANRVREGVLMHRTNLASFLDTVSITSPELTFDHVSRTLHGHEPMGLSDLVVWANEFDTVREILTTVFADSIRTTAREG